MQPYIILLYITTLHAHGYEKLAQGFYTAATWLGIEPRIRLSDALWRLVTVALSAPYKYSYLLTYLFTYLLTYFYYSTSKPPSHR